MSKIVNVNLVTIAITVDYNQVKVHIMGIIIIWIDYLHNSQNNLMKKLHLHVMLILPCPALRCCESQKKNK